MHGKPSVVHSLGGALFKGFPEQFTVGRYHSLVADPSQLPACLRVTARTTDGMIMAIEHESLPISAVQFHPESILSLPGEVGRALIHNVAESTKRRLIA
jgi:anthranilate synthase